MPAGRPPTWNDPEAFSKAIDEYFAKEGEVIYTWAGLALHLGFESRQSLQDYKEKGEFAYPIKIALLRIESQYEKAAMLNKNAAGPIFALKNFGWKDKQEIDLNAQISKGFLNIDPLADDPTDNSTTQDSATTEA